MERVSFAKQLAFTAAAVACVGPTIGQEPSAAGPPERVATFISPAEEPPPAEENHPLLPALRLAQESRQAISENIRDYTCTMIRRERIAGKLGSYEFIDVKLRHEQTSGGEVTTPFSVYLHFNKPARVEGREALYVAGRNAGKVFVKRGGQRMSYLSSFIKPDSRLAMRENRYPITEIGFKRMVERLIEEIEKDLQYGECQVQFFTNAKVGDRTCTRVEVVHPVERDHFSFHRAVVFVDEQDKLPVGYAAFYWPEEPGGEPRLLEEYIFTDIRLNVGLNDEDFDRDNPDYGFNRDEEDETEG